MASAVALASRLPDWDRRLSDMVAANVSRPHAYGSWDCLVGISAAAIEAVTGLDLAAPHRGKYRSMAGASRYLRGLGHDTPEAFLDALFSEKAVGFAQAGDLVLVPGDGGGWPIPALCWGGVALCIGEGGAGLVAVPRAQWLKAWRVGAAAGRLRSLVR